MTAFSDSGFRIEGRWERVITCSIFCEEDFLALGIRSSALRCISALATCDTNLRYCTDVAQK